MRVSANEKLIAVALGHSNNNQDFPAKIEIYDIDYENQKLVTKHHIDNISSK